MPQVRVSSKHSPWAGGSTPASLITFSDDFDRANAVLRASELSSGDYYWITCTNAAGVQYNINTNEAVASGNNCVAAVATELLEDSYSQIDVELSQTLVNSGPMTRITGLANGYYVTIGINNNLFRYLNGAATLLGTGAQAQIGDVMKLESVGNTHTVYINGVSNASATDSNHPRGLVGLFAASGGAINNFEGGEI